MNKVVINRCYGSFKLSNEAIIKLVLLKLDKGITLIVKENNNGLYIAENISRHDEDLIRVVEELGEEASGVCANLEVVHIDGNVYRIRDYDGFEYVEEPDESEWIIIKQ